MLEITWEGTQTGAMVSPGGTIPPSGKKVTLQAAQVVTVEGGKVKETRHYFDMAGMLEQMGAMAR